MLYTRIQGTYFNTCSLWDSWANHSSLSSYPRGCGVHGDIDLLCSNFKQSDTIGTLRALLAARTKTTTLLQPPSTYWYMYTYTLGPIPSNTKWLKLPGCFNHCESIWLGTLDLYYYFVFGRIWWIIISQGFHVSKRLVLNGMHQTPFWLKVSSVSHGALIFQPTSALAYLEYRWYFWVSCE